VLLQHSARAAKDRALAELGRLALRRVGGPHDEFRAKVERIRADVEGLRSGAFAGFSQNPVVRGLLLSLGGGGALTLLEMLLNPR
jgi:hypothetical protein